MIKKGVILAGGTGSRLSPITKITNKHLLPIYNQPMIFYPIATLKKAGILEILIISGQRHAGDFAKLLLDGSEFNMNFSFRVQKGGDGGVAEALYLAKNFAGNDNIAVILGDNIFEDDFSDQINNFQKGAHIFLKKVSQANRFGVAEIDNHKNVINIEEKPNKPKTNFAVTGFYLFDNTVFQKIEKCKISPRGELEITDVNNFFIQENKMTASFVSGNWTDAGTFESFFKATCLAKDLYDKSKENN